MKGREKCKQYFILVRPIHSLHPVLKQPTWDFLLHKEHFYKVTIFLNNQRPRPWIYPQEPCSCFHKLESRWEDTTATLLKSKFTSAWHKGFSQIEFASKLPREKKSFNLGMKVKRMKTLFFVLNRRSLFIGKYRDNLVIWKAKVVTVIFFKLFRW